MKFSKKRFKENAPKDIQRKLKEHLDVLDGMKVKFEDDFGKVEYIFNGKGYELYPVYKQWCEK